MERSHVRTATAAGFACFVMGGFLAWLLTAPDTIKREVEVAQWGVLVAIVSTLALAYIGYQANKLVRAAHDRDSATRRQQARLLVVYLAPEWYAARVEVEVIKVLLEGEANAFRFSGSNWVRRHVADRTERIIVSESASRLEQAHVLPPAVGSNLAKALGNVKLLQNAARTAASMKTPGTYRDAINQDVEPKETTPEAIEEFDAAFRMLMTSAIATIMLFDELIKAVKEAAAE